MLRNGHKEQDQMLGQDVGSAETYWLPTHQETSLETEQAWMKRTPVQLLSHYHQDRHIHIHKRKRLKMYSVA